MTSHDCGIGGLLQCETHPRVHVTKDRFEGTWTIWKPTTGGCVLAASTGWSHREKAMQYAQELARLLTLVRGKTRPPPGASGVA